MKAVFKTAYPYLEDAMNLPVENLEAAIPFYETIMGFQVLGRKETPFKSAVLGRDGIQIGLAENGGDPTPESRQFWSAAPVVAALACLTCEVLHVCGLWLRLGKSGDKALRRTPFRFSDARREFFHQPAREGFHERTDSRRAARTLRCRRIAAFKGSVRRDPRIHTNAH